MNPRNPIDPPFVPENDKHGTSRRCRVAQKFGTGTLFRGEIGQLLHSRLRIVTFITLVPFGLFLLRNLTGGHQIAPTGELGVWMQAIVTIVMAGLGIVLWRWPNLSLAGLRRIELTLFGLLAVFFCWLQLYTFGNDALSHLVADHPKAELARLQITQTSMRWFFLIVIYGVFIPNTWRRCATITGLTALAPLLLTPLSAVLWKRHDPDIVDGLISLGIFMLTACAVAVFGSYRLHLLQQEAFQAQQLGQYRLKTKLGSGGMGEVYKAEHVLLHRPCAIKLIRPDQTSDPSVLQRFEREVQAMAALTHWNTVEIFDFGRADDGTFYYAMEYLPGPNLETLVTHHGPVAPERAIHFLRQICGALREAHGTGLLHRDIKPSNVIVCARGGIHDVAKLLDFGLVQETGLKLEASRLTVQGTVLGSPPYMAPEQASGRTDLDVRADIYSLGAVGYFLLTGQPPFVRDTPMEMLLAHAYEQVIHPSEIRSNVPADLQSVILRCLSKKREDRFASAEAMERALADCAAADHWTEAQAKAWWDALETQTETFAHPEQAMPTPQEV